MVSRNYVIKFEFTDELYAKYKTWCEENHLNGRYGTIGGSHHFEIVPTSLGDCIAVVAESVVMDELGEPSYDEQGKLKLKQIRLDLEGLEVL